MTHTQLIFGRIFNVLFWILGQMRGWGVVCENGMENAVFEKRWWGSEKWRAAPRTRSIVNVYPEEMRKESLHLASHR